MGQTSRQLLVPSAIVPEERNVLINPLHTDSPHLVAVKRRRWLVVSQFEF